MLPIINKPLVSDKTQLSFVGFLAGLIPYLINALKVIFRVHGKTTQKKQNFVEMIKE